MREGGGAVGNTLKGGGTEKRGGETEILKRGQAGSRGGCLKKGGWNPLTNYASKSETLNSER